MNDFLDLFLSIVAYSGGAAALVSLVVGLITKNLIDTSFEKRIEAFKKAQERELELYRHQINVLYSRVSKIHDKEIEILPELWRKLQEVLGSVVQITSPLQTYPDIERMNPEDLENFLNKSNLSQTHQKKIKESEHKNDDYQQIIFWYDLAETRKALIQFRNCLINNRIFLSKDIKQEFEEIDRLLISVLTIRETGEYSRDWDIIVEAYQDLNKKAKIIVDRIENLIQLRLDFVNASSSFNKK